MRTIKCYRLKKDKTKHFIESFTSFEVKFNAAGSEVFVEIDWTKFAVKYEGGQFWYKQTLPANGATWATVPDFRTLKHRLGV